MNILLILAIAIFLVLGAVYGARAWKVGKKSGTGHLGDFIGYLGVSVICFGVAVILFLLII